MFIYVLLASGLNFKKKMEDLKKNAGFFFFKKMEILHLWKVWEDVKSDAFTSVKLSRQM
jgi:hypothetical protein